MKATIFYSWQSDTKAAANRTLIQEALDSIAVEPVIERDTKGVPGAPDIGGTILEKIDASAAVVADVTIVSRGNGRPTPNPNVLIELGYALKSLGARRLILVQNVAFGGPEDLPFDLRQKRVLTYSSKEDASERAPERRRLQADLKEALALVLVDADAHPREISDEAKRLLVTAADGGGNLLRIPVIGGTKIQVGRQQMAKLCDRRDQARWEAALQELVAFGLVEPRGDKGEVFLLTHAGYQLADIIKERMSSSPKAEDLNQ